MVGRSNTGRNRKGPDQGSGPFFCRLTLGDYATVARSIQAVLS